MKQKDEIQLQQELSVDISDDIEKNTDMANKEGDDKFHSLFMNMTEGAALHELILDENGEAVDYVIIDANPAFEEQLGISRETVVGKTSREAYLVDEPPYFEIYKQVAQSGVPTHFETHFPPLDKYFSISVYCPYKGSFATIFKDITQEKQNEKAILRTKEALSFLAQYSKAGQENDFFRLLAQYLAKTLEADFVCIDSLEGDGLNARTVAVWCDGVFEDNVVYALKDTPCGVLVGKTVCCFPASVCTYFPDDIVLQDLKAESYVGATLWSHTGEAIGLIAVIKRNRLNNQQHAEELLKLVSVRAASEMERIKAEEALRQSEEMYRLLLENSGIGVGVYGLDGEIKMFNQKALQNLGGKLEDYIGKSLTDIYGQETASVYITRFHKAVNSETSIEYEDCVPMPNGMRWFLSNHSKIVGLDGKIIGVQVLASDITERKHAEKEIQLQNDVLRQLNATKDKFFSIIAHDLKSPFNSFLGLIQIMAEDLPSLTMSEIQNIVYSMSKSATNLYRLLENLLQWSQIQKGAIRFNPEPVQLGLLVDESIEMIHESAQRKGIEIAIDVPDGLSVTVDVYMLQSVIRNLVSNAVKFTRRDGKVNLFAKATNNNIELSIQDTGIGMNQTMLGNLFRIDIATNRKGTDGEPSTGLGLILCKEFIEKHGGEIWVESEEGKGSTFYFTIPLNTVPVIG